MYIDINEKFASSIDKAWEKYIKLHNDITSGKLPSRYVVYKPNGQLCNHIRGVISAALFALITVSLANNFFIILMQSI